MTTTHSVFAALVLLAVFTGCYGGADYALTSDDAPSMGEPGGEPVSTGTRTGASTGADGGTSGEGGGETDDDGGVVSPSGMGPWYCREVKPILDSYCATCHGAPPSGGAPATFRLDVFGTVDGIVGAGAKALRIKARAADTRTMPPTGAAQPTDAERAVLAAWANAGAPECEDSTNVGVADGGAGNSVGYESGPVSFTKHIVPLLQTYCTSCHSGANAERDFDVTSANLYSELMAVSQEDNDYRRVEPGHPQRSMLWIGISASAPGTLPAMPFATPGLAVTAPEDHEVIETWIEQGAPNN